MASDLEAARRIAEALPSCLASAPDDNSERVGSRAFVDLTPQEEEAVVEALGEFPALLDELARLREVEKAARAFDEEFYDGQSCPSCGCFLWPRDVFEQEHDDEDCLLVALRRRVHGAGGEPVPRRGTRDDVPHELCERCGRAVHSSSTLVDALGITYRQLDYFTANLDWPLAQTGSGSYRRWSTAEVATLAALVALDKAGIRRSIAVTHAVEIYDQLHALEADHGRGDAA